MRRRAEALRLCGRGSCTRQQTYRRICSCSASPASDACALDPRCRRGGPGSRQRTHRRISAGDESTGSDARVLDLGVREDVLALASRHTYESVLAERPQAVIPANSSSGLKRMSSCASAGTPTDLAWQRIHGQRRLGILLGVQEDIHVLASSYTDEAVLAARPRVATLTHSTSVFKRMSLCSPAGTPTNLSWQRINKGSDVCALDLGLQEDITALAAGTPTNLFLRRPHGQRRLRTRPRCSRGCHRTRQQAHP